MLLLFTLFALRFMGSKVRKVVITLWPVTIHRRKGPLWAIIAKGQSQCMGPEKPVRKLRGHHSRGTANSPPCWIIPFLLPSRRRVWRGECAQVGNSITNAKLTGPGRGTCLPASGIASSGTPAPPGAPYQATHVPRLVHVAPPLPSPPSPWLAWPPPSGGPPGTRSLPNLAQGLSTSASRGRRGHPGSSQSIKKSWHAKRYNKAQFGTGQHCCVLYRRAGHGTAQQQFGSGMI